MNKSLIIFGIVNITSDSFSDGGRYLAPDAAIAQARKLMAEGADVIDLGPASSNPDAAPVSSDTEIARIAPELVALGWTVTEFAAGKYDITRPKRWPLKALCKKPVNRPTNASLKGVAGRAHLSRP